MFSTFLALTLGAIVFEGVSAARPFLEYPDTGLAEVVSDVAVGALPELDEMVGVPDFEWAAQNYLPIVNYTYYRSAVGGEWSYRNNLEVFNRYRFIPRQMRDVRRVAESLNTTILGYHFDSPFFISPCARAEYGHVNAELNLVEGAAYGNILYIVSDYSTIDFEDLSAAAAENQTLFTQIYFTPNETLNLELIRAADAAGSKAIVWSVDSPGRPDRQRGARYSVTSANERFVRHTWEAYDSYRNVTSLPIILKGIQNVQDAKEAVARGVPCIVLSNHGGRNLDGSPSALEIALDIYKEDPNIFNQIEVLADGGVRYGTDALKLMALGVKAVGLGRPFMYANIFGVDGVKKMVDLFRESIISDAANLGLADLKSINASYVSWTPNSWYS